MLIVDNISWFVEGYPGMVKKKTIGSWNFRGQEHLEEWEDGTSNGTSDTGMC